MAISNAATDILGINRSKIGGPCEVIKDSGGTALNNVLEAYKFLDKDGVQHQLVTLYHPEITLNSTASAVDALLYKDFAIGSRVLCANGVATKLSAAGAANSWGATIATNA